MKKIAIALTLALAAILVFGSTVLAWDYEDPCVVDNEDFLWDQGWDGGYPDGTLESYYGEQSWSYYETPSDGYNLYRDDVTGTGNLDAIQSLVTRTPEAIDLPGATIQYFDMDGGFYYMTSISPDTWYWATSPRGYNDPVPDTNPHYLNIILPDASITVPLCGGATYTVDVSDGTWALHIPRGTSIRNPDNSIAVSLVIDSNGNIVSDVRFVYCRGGEVTVTGVGP